MPLVRRVPKRGFHSPFRVEFQVVNVETLEKLASTGKVSNGIVSPEVLAKLGVIKKLNVPVKILGNGELKAKLSISANAFSKSAVEKIEKAGGKAQTIIATTTE
jgi:large subunit ribosomal protein L15